MNNAGHILNPILSLFLLCVTLLSQVSVAASITDEFPALREDLFIEPKSDFLIGVGANPIVIFAKRIAHVIRPLEVHLVTPLLDWEIFSVGLGFSSVSSNDYSTSRHFFIRTVPKLCLGSVLSLGPLLGFEYVSFPGVRVKLSSNGYETPEQALTSQGMIYGLSLSQVFSLDQNMILKLSQTLFQQTYAADRTSNGWSMRFSNSELQNESNKSSIAAGTGVMIEMSLLFM